MFGGQKCNILRNMLTASLTGGLWHCSSSRFLLSRGLGQSIWCCPQQHARKVTKRWPLKRRSIIFHGIYHDLGMCESGWLCVTVCDMLLETSRRWGRRPCRCVIGSPRWIAPRQNHVTHCIEICETVRRVRRRWLSISFSISNDSNTLQHICSICITLLSIALRL